MELSGGHRTQVNEIYDWGTKCWVSKQILVGTFNLIKTIGKSSLLDGNGCNDGIT